MQRDPQKVSAVLADATRYEIYRFVVGTPRPVSVAQVAGQFRIHPNVARMHLGKLAEIGLLHASLGRTGRGGRPGFMYEPSGDPVSVSIPGREFGLLADLLVQSLMLLGDRAKSAVDQIGESFGERVGREAVEGVGRSPGEHPLEASAAALRLLGIAAAVADEQGRPRLVLKSCGFKEVAAAHPEYVCRLCAAMVRGITRVCADEGYELALIASLPHGDRECVYATDGLIRLD